MKNHRSGFTLIELLVVIANVTILTAFQFPVAARASEAAPPFYALQQTKESDDLFNLRLYDKKTGQTIWTRKCFGAYSPRWSFDHRSFAIVIGHIYGQNTLINGQNIFMRLLYWREGHDVQLVKYPNLFIDFDDVINLRWSPDGRRFAFIGGSTVFEAGGPYWGSLGCVNAVNGYFYFGPLSVGRYCWIDSQRIRYIARNYTPKTYRDPKTHQEVFDLIGHWERPRYWTGSYTFAEWKDPDWLRGKIRLHGRRWPW
jgi:prepilin-type N-terminal cleavage/methylation domain-containing protein